MPFEIVRNDIVNMQVDAIVNTANPAPVIGYGVDAGIHQKAGHRLLEARQKIGNIKVGKSEITPGFELDAKYVIHTVGPVWQGGDFKEEKLLRSCYESALKLALKNNCESIAFPLISAGNHGFPKNMALEIAVGVFSNFLLKHDMNIYLVVFSRDAFALSEKLFNSVSSYIDENYISEKILDEYGVKNKCDVRQNEISQLLEETIRQREEEVMCDYCAMTSMQPTSAGEPFFEKSSFKKMKLEELLKETDEGFSETLLKLIDKTGQKDSYIYKKANIDRKLFSKIRNNPDYKPSKTTAVAFAIALELNLEDTKDFIGRAGFTLSHSSKFDIIIEYFITNKNYDIFEINETLFAFDQNLLGA